MTLQTSEYFELLRYSQVFTQRLLISLGIDILLVIVFRSSAMAPSVYIIYLLA